MISFCLSAPFRLNGPIAAHALAIGGLGRLNPRDRLRAAGVAALILMDVAPIWRVATVSNPECAPGWRIPHFPPGEEPSA